MAMPNHQTAGQPAKSKSRNAKRQAHLKAVQDTIEDLHPEETLIARWADKASTGALLCRNNNHAFPDAELLTLYRINGTYSMRELECQRCHTKRIDLVVSDTLQVVNRRYDYVVGYQREQGSDGKRGIPRHAVVDALASRIDFLEPPGHIKELFGKMGQGYYR